jgi:hypothetical protein
MKLSLFWIAISVSSIAFAAPAAPSDQDLFKFIQGKWTFASASCLSGAAPQWEENPRDYEYNMEFRANKSFHIEEKHLHQLSMDQNGLFSIQQANLLLRSVKTCYYYPDSTDCSAHGQSSSLISVQGAQLWLLVNEGGDTGVCPARDVFITKYDRQ